MARKSIITIANEQVDIRIACELIGISLPEIPEGRSVKVHCPFGDIYHSDGGVETAFRVYPHSNSAYCFACSEFFTPVGLYAKANNLRWEDAALALLDRIGYKPVSLADRWASIVHSEDPPDTAMLAQALKTYCSRSVENWQTVQFEPSIAQMLDRCLALLDRVSNAEEARTWLDASKIAMKKVLVVRA